MGELELFRPSWKFFFRNQQARTILAQIQHAQKTGSENFQLFKTTTGRRRIYLFAPQDGEKKYLIKAYLPAKLSKRIKYLFRNSRCKQEFVASQKFEQLGIPAVKAIIFGYRSEAGLPAEEIVIEPYLEGHQTFSDLWKNLIREEREELFKALASLVAEMHKKGVLQRDFKPDSLLVKKSPGGFELVLSDLERIKFFRPPLSHKRQLDNLGKILQAFFALVPCEEQDWLLKNYARCTGEDFVQEKILEQIVLYGKKHLLKLAHQRKNWAETTNELIEKFETESLEVRVFKEIGKEVLEKWLNENPKLTPGLIELTGKKMQVSSSFSAKAQMANYFFLRELKINCRKVLWAIDFKNQAQGIFALEVSEGEVPYFQILEKLSEPDRAKLLSEYHKFIQRLQFLGLNLSGSLEEKILVQTSSSGYQLRLASPELDK